MKPCRRLVAARPPTPLLPSNTVTVFPASRRICAAAIPLQPAPITAIDFNDPFFPGGFIAPSSVLKRKLLPPCTHSPLYQIVSLSHTLGKQNKKTAMCSEDILASLVCLFLHPFKICRIISKTILGPPILMSASTEKKYFHQNNPVSF